MTKSFDTVQVAFRLHDDGYNLSQISRELGVSRFAIRSWFVQPLDAFSRRAAHDRGECPLIGGLPAAEYAYLLGQYLGDGSISAIGPRDVFKLRIATCDDYPDIRQRCIATIEAVMPTNTVGVQPGDGCAEVWCCSKHWPCLFPQHGPGKKHERPIVLEPWQEKIVATHPEQFVAGLIHSDGSRCTNNIVTRGKPYSYPRYFFTNSSYDILMLCGQAFDMIGIEWRQNRWNCLSVAKRDSVALLDTFIGPKT